MFLYRAINEFDSENISNKGAIYCNMKRNDDIIKENGLETLEIINEIPRGDQSISLSRTIGHVRGANIHNSCWISFSNDFNYVMKEYAIPQSGNYNKDDYRKEIVVTIFEDSDEITEEYCKGNRTSKCLTEKYIDLSKNNLNKYVKRGLIIPITGNKHSVKCKYKYVINHEDNDYDVSISNNFATAASEHLVFFGINRIDYLLSPLAQDIIYCKTYNTNNKKDIEIIISSLAKLCENIQEDVLNGKYNLTNEEINIFNYLYTKKDNKYNSLIHFVPLIYKEGHNIVDIYEGLKTVKKNILKKILNCDNICLVDDGIYVNSYENMENNVLHDGRSISDKNRNDIIYTTDDSNKLVRLTADLNKEFKKEKKKTKRKK